MTDINDMRVESWIEYAVITADGIVHDCDTKEEAHQLARAWDRPVMQRRIYQTGWQSLSRRSGPR